MLPKSGRQNAKPPSPPPSSGPIQPAILVNPTSEYTKTDWMKIILSSFEKRFSPLGVDVRDIQFYTGRGKRPRGPLIINLGTNHLENAVLDDSTWGKIEQKVAETIEPIPCRDGDHHQHLIDTEIETIKRLSSLIGSASGNIISTTAVKDNKGRDATSSSLYDRLNAKAHLMRRNTTITADEKHLHEFIFYSTTLVMRYLSETQVSKLTG